MNSVLALVLAVLALAGVIAAAAAFALARRERDRADRLLGELRLTQDRAIRAEAKAEAAEHAKSEVGDTFRALSAETLGRTAEDLLKRAEEAFASRDRLAQERLHAQLKPVADTLAKFEHQVATLEKERAEQHGGLKEQIAALTHASAVTQQEARRLTEALRRGSGVRGRWGEETLRNVLEAAGMHGHYDFIEQPTLPGENDRMARPDVLVRLPGGGAFVIDAKAVFQAYFDAQDATDEAQRQQLLQQHADDMRRTAQGLGARSYWTALERSGRRSPDFVAMFVPSDALLCSAADRVPDLMKTALESKVVIVTPTTLFALCKAVAYGWRAEQQAENAAKVADVGRELYKRLATMGEHVKALGGALTTAANKYNAFVGSLETQVLPQARRFEDLKVEHTGKALPELPLVETSVRPLAKLASPIAEAA